jgi:hypothetical protein
LVHRLAEGRSYGTARGLAAARHTSIVRLVSDEGVTGIGAADARECRQRASRCAELAMTARTMQLKAAFLELSKNWERLAIDLEDSLGRRDEMEALRSDVRDSLTETKRLSHLLATKNSTT